MVYIFVSQAGIHTKKNEKLQSKSIAKPTSEEMNTKKQTTGPVLSSSPIPFRPHLIRTSTHILMQNSLKTPCDMPPSRNVCHAQTVKKKEKKEEKNQDTRDSSASASRGI